MEKHEKPRLTSGIWHRALEHERRDGDGADRAGDQGARGRVASAINLLDPETVIIGGGLGVRFGESRWRPARGDARAQLFRPRGPP